MFIFSRHFWMLHRVSLEHKFPDGPPGWVRVVSPVIWVAYYLLAIPMNWLKRLKRRIYGPYPNRRHLLRLNEAALTERGAAGAGCHILLKCPECGTPVLHEDECESFYPDVSNLSKCQPLGGDDETCDCIKCGFKFTWRMIYACYNNPRSGRRFLVSGNEARAFGLGWMLAETVRPEER